MPYVWCRCSATEVLPQPAGPVITHICFVSLLSVERAAVVELDAIFVEVGAAGSQGGVGGRCVDGSSEEERCECADVGRNGDVSGREPIVQLSGKCWLREGFKAEPQIGSGVGFRNRDRSTVNRGLAWVRERIRR